MFDLRGTIYLKFKEDGPTLGCTTHTKTRYLFTTFEGISVFSNHVNMAAKIPKNNVSDFDCF